MSRYPADAPLVQDLRRASAVFAHHRATGTAARHASDRRTIRHPQVGDLLLDCDVLIVPGADLRVVAYTTATDGDDVGKFDLLRVTGGRTAPASP